MRIVCPSCAAAYEVPEPSISPGRVVRCARCAAEWAPTQATQAVSAPVAPAPTVAAPVEPPPVPADRWPGKKLERLAGTPVMPAPILPVPQPLAPPAAMRRAPESAPVRKATGTAIGWILSLVLLAVLAAGAYAKRDDIVRAWPPSERAYAALGIPTRADAPP